LRDRWTVRLIRASWSLLWLGLFLFGLPAALIRFAGWPLPDRLPARADLARWVSQPFTSETLINLVVGLLWLVWVWLVYTVLVELLRWLTRLRLPRVRLPGPLHSATSGLVGALMLAVTGGGPPGASPGPSVTANADADQASTPLTLAAASPDPQIPQRADPSPGDVDGGDEPAGMRTAVGVDLPGGGWVNGPLAEQVATAAAMVWWQRRRRYLPGAAMLGGQRDDPDLIDLPTTATAIQQAVGGPPDLPVPTSAATPAEDPLWAWRLPASGAGLTGPGAADAARGLLVAAVLAASHGPAADRVLATAADLRTLLGTPPERYRDLPGLTIVDSVDELISDIVGSHDHGWTGRPALPRKRLDTPDRPMATAAAPLLVLLANAPDRRQRRQLARLLAQPTTTVASAAPLRLAVLGGWPIGTTWRVDADGTAFSTSGHFQVVGRLSVLPAGATLDLLTLLTTLANRGRPPVTEAEPLEDLAVAPAANATLTFWRDHEPAPGTAVFDRPADGRAIPHGAPDAPAARPLRLQVLGVVRLSQLVNPPARARGQPYDAGPSRGTGTAVGEQELRLPRSAAVQIAVYLAAHPDGATGAAVARAVWPGVPAPASRLRTTLSTLRTSLEDAAGQPVLRRDGDRYRLDSTTIDVDLWQLHAAVDRAARALNADDRQAALREVVAAYTGDLAAGAIWPWLPSHREAARRHVVDALSALAGAAADHRVAVELLHQAVGHDPDNEHLHRQLMHAQAAAGDLDGAAHTFHRLARRLADHGSQPSTATIDLAQQLIGDQRRTNDPT